MKGLLVILLVLVSGVATAQPDTLWMKFYPDWEGNDQCKRLIRTADGGFMIGGKTGFPDYDYLLVKIDSEFNTEWARIYGDLQQQDYFGGVVQMPDGGYILAGSIQRNAGGIVSLLKVDANGDSLWSHEYGTTEFYDVTLSHDGYPVAAGLTNEHAEHGSFDAWLLKADENGDVIWSEVFGGAGGDFFNKVILISDNGFMGVGRVGSSGLVVKVDSLGQLQWQRSIRSDGNVHGFMSVVEIADGGFVACGYGEAIREDLSDYQYYVVKLTSAGDTVWTRKWGSQRIGTNFINEIILAPGGGYLAVGQSADWGYAVVRLNEEGEVLWELPFEGRRSGDQFFAGLLLDDNSYLLGGWADTRMREAEAWLVRTTPDSTMLNAVVLLDPAFPSQFVVGAPYPNPFNSTTTIRFGLDKSAPTRIAVYGLDGRLVAELLTGGASVNPLRLTGSNTATRRGAVEEMTIIWNAAGFPAGEYFLRLQAGREEAVRRIVLVK